MATKSTTCFIIFALVWQIAVGLLYGFYMAYNQSAITTMQSTSTNVYVYKTDSTAGTRFQENSTQFPFPLVVVAFGFIILTVGFSLIAGYIQKASISSMAFTLLILAFTLQNFFIYRNFWDGIGLNDPNGTYSFVGRYYRQIGLINYGNDLQTSYNLETASFIDAFGAVLAMFAGYSAVIGKIGLGEIFFLTWIGVFGYELNSLLLWRLYIPDNGFPLRAFGFGGALGLVSSLILGKKQQTFDNPNYKSNYKTMTLSFIGVILVWCTFPILTLTSVYTAAGDIIGSPGQVNIWLSLAASVLGAFTASSFNYKKFSVHDMVFSSITGAIAYSPCTDINFNPGAALAIGYIVGFVCSLVQTGAKRLLNKGGVIDSNSVVFGFLMPSFFAAISAAICQGVGGTETSMASIAAVTTVTTTINYANLKELNRSFSEQGGFQIIGWLISVGIGAITGVVVGIIYKVINDNYYFFDDINILEQPHYKSKDASYAIDNQRQQ